MKCTFWGYIKNYNFNIFVRWQMAARLTILKCTEVLNYCGVCQELTQCCRSVILENKLRKRAQIFGYQRQGVKERKWIKAVKRYKLPVTR